MKEKFNLRRGVLMNTSFQMRKLNLKREVKKIQLSYLIVSVALIKKSVESNYISVKLIFKFVLFIIKKPNVISKI